MGIDETGTTSTKDRYNTGVTEAYVPENGEENDIGIRVREPRERCTTGVLTSGWPPC